MNIHDQQSAPPATAEGRCPRGGRGAQSGQGARRGAANARTARQRIPLPRQGTRPPRSHRPATGSAYRPPSWPRPLIRPEAASWLPQPPWFVRYAVQCQRADSASSWQLFRDALRRRSSLTSFRDTTLSWLPGPRDTLVPGRPLLSRFPCDEGKLAANSAAWWLVDRLPH